MILEVSNLKTNAFLCVLWNQLLWMWADIHSTSGSIPVDPEAAVVQLEDPAAHYVSLIHSDRKEEFVREFQ